MDFYAVNGNDIVFVKLDQSQIEEGKIYNTPTRIKWGHYKFEKQCYIYEYCDPKNETVIIAREDGQKPFASATNDCIRDNFPKNCLARVVLSKDYYLIYAYYDNNSIVTSHTNKKLNFIVFRIVDCAPEFKDIPEFSSINIQCVARFDSGDIPKTDCLDEAIQHVIMVNLNYCGEQVTLKYSFNPGRIVTTKLFQRNEQNELVSYTEEGKKIILNNNSFELYKDAINAEMNDNIILRCFYSRKFINKKVLFVDGIRVDLLQEWEVPYYLEKSNLSDSAASSLLKKAVTKYGYEFYVISDVTRGEIRPIYKSSKDWGYSTFPLSVYEADYIKELKDVNI